MICTTVREGQDCVFMANSGCTYNQGSCRQIIDKCEGCARLGEFPTGKFCTVHPDPASKWKIGNCNMATHIVKAAAAAKEKLNPIKASKRGSKK